MFVCVQARECVYSYVTLLVCYARYHGPTEVLSVRVRGQGQIPAS